jgi:parvulin-like peptidyl-prolyl isomerase
LSNLTKGVAVIAVILAIGAGLVFWKAKVGSHGSESLNRLTKEDMKLLLADASPMQLQQMASNPEAKKKIAENIRQLLAVASQARKEGMADDEKVKRELESTRSIVIASLYDKHINKDKGQMPPFGFITEEQTKKFWEENPERRELEFKQFLDGKIELAKETGRFPADKTLTEEETKQAKDDYAKIKIYEEEANAKMKELGEEFKHNVELQVKLQQAQFLASRYANKTLVEKVKVTDEDINKYIAEHPEYSTADKRATAEQILSRAKAGEDFAKLATEFSQDPGSKDKGGLYEAVTKGKMVPEFEQAALSLQPGNIFENLVETPYGYHIIKLEKKGEGKDATGQPAETYDVRHILITTTMKDPNNPMGREMPIKDSVKALLEEKKQKEVLDEIVKNNPVEVPEDFEIPQPSEEDMKMMQQQMMQQQGQMPMQMPEEMENAPANKPAPKPSPKKK